MTMYNVRLSNGTLFINVSDTTMLQMMEKLDVLAVESPITGETLYLNHDKSAGKVGGITRANTLPYMVTQSFIYPNGSVKDYVMENQPEEDAKSWLSLTKDNPELDTYCKEYGGLLTSVVVFRKTRGGYEQIGRVDF